MDTAEEFVQYAQDGWTITVTTDKVCLACLIATCGGLEIASGITVNDRDKLALIQNYVLVPTREQCDFRDEEGHAE